MTERRTRDERPNGTGLPWCRVKDSREEKHNSWCESCGEKIEGPYLESPADGHTASSTCLPCVKEALAEYERQ